MRVTFLGTNGWYDTETGNTLCTLIETRKEYIILDAGNGLYKIDKYIKTKKPIYLFLSHFHLDHIIGLHILNKFDFSQGIDFYGPPSMRKSLSRVIAKPYTVPIRKMKTKIRLNELYKKSSIPIDVEFKKLKHSSVCYGFRFILEDKIISYCSDTGVCDNLFRLAKNADLLIAECSSASGQKPEKWPHLNPEQAALAAKKSRVKKMILTHFNPNLYIRLKDRKMAEKNARKIFKDSFAAVDNMQFQI